MHYDLCPFAILPVGQSRRIVCSPGFTCEWRSASSRGSAALRALAIPAQSAPSTWANPSPDPSAESRACEQRAKPKRRHTRIAREMKRSLACWHARCKGAAVERRAMLHHTTAIAIPYSLYFTQKLQTLQSLDVRSTCCVLVGHTRYHQITRMNETSVKETEQQQSVQTAINRIKYRYLT